MVTFPNHVKRYILPYYPIQPTSFLTSVSRTHLQYCSFKNNLSGTRGHDWKTTNQRTHTGQKAAESARYLCQKSVWQS